MKTDLLPIVTSLLIPGTADGTAVVWAKRLLTATIVFALFWLFAQLVRHLLERFGTKLSAFTKTDLDDRLLKRITPSITLLLSTLGCYIALSTLPLQERFFKVLSGVLFVALVVICAVIIYRVVDELLSRYLDRLQHQEEVISRSMMPLVRKLATIVLCGASLIIILKKFNYDILSLLTALGIGSLAIGLAAKDTLAQMISGFILLIDRPFRIGDRIRLAGGQVGDVVDIGMRSTKIQGLDTTVMIIPNSDLCNATVVNMVRPTAVIQGRITLGIGYDSDVERAKELLLEIARNNAGVLEEPAPVAQFTSFGDSALNLLLLFWVADPTRLGAVTDQLNCAILRKFRDSGVAIPYPTRTVHLQQLDLSS